MKEYLLSAVILLVASSIGFGLWQKARADKAEARAEIAEGLVKAHEEANRVLNSYLRKVEEERDYWESQSNQLEGKEGIDDPLSPYLRSVLELVQ